MKVPKSIEIENAHYTSTVHCNVMYTRVSIENCINVFCVISLKVTINIKPDSSPDNSDKESSKDEETPDGREEDPVKQEHTYEKMKSFDENPYQPYETPPNSTPDNQPSNPDVGDYDLAGPPIVLTIPEPDNSEEKSNPDSSESSDSSDSGNDDDDEEPKVPKSNSVTRIVSILIRSSKSE